MTEPLRIVVITSDLAVQDPEDTHAQDQADRSRSLRIGLLESGFNLIATRGTAQAIEAGAARKLSLRCTSTTDSALPTKSSAQSSAESPPPQITSCRPWKRSGCLTR